MNEARLDFLDRPFTGGESFRDVCSQDLEFLEDLDRRGGPMLIIAHRATWYALEHLLHGRNLAEVIAAPWSWQPGWKYELA